MKTKYILSIVVITFLIGCNSDSSTKNPISDNNTSTQKPIHVEFRYGISYTKKGEKKAITMSVSPQQTKIGKIYNLAKELDIDSCKIIDTKNINIKDKTIYNVGDILVTAEWSEKPLSILKYNDFTKNYNASALFGTNPAFVNYTTDERVTFSSSKFNISGSAIKPIKILNPKRENGNYPNVNKNMPLNIVWSGGSSQDIIIFLKGYWTSWIPSEPETLVCHVENDGKFTIPQDILKSFQWRQKTNLVIEDMKIIKTKNAKLNMHSFVELYIYENKNAKPPSPTATMQEGYVENRCSTKEECGGGDCLHENIFHDGYCSLIHCKSDNECPSDAHCFIEKGQFSIPQFCSKPCSVDSDCRTPYYHCREDDMHIKSCVPAVF